MEKFLACRPEYTQPPTPRLTFLYSSLAPRKTANPTGFNSALSWWNSLLLDLTKHGLGGEDRLSLCVDERLREGLRWTGVGRPSSLATVVSELCNQNQLVASQSYFETSNPSATWISLLAKPLLWSFSRLKISVLGDSSTGENAEEGLWNSIQGVWIFPALVKEAASRIVPELETLHVDPLSRLYTIKTLQSTIDNLTLPGLDLSAQDCLVLVEHLSKTTPPTCIVQGELIKFTCPYTKTPLLITSTDTGIISLLTTLALLSLQITSLESRIATEQESMRSYSVKKQVTMVRSALIRRKQLEGLLEKRVLSRERLREVLTGIEGAVGDEATMTALNTATTTLRTLISSPTLSLEKIDQTTLALSEALADAEEINIAISAPGREALAAQGGDEEVERELRELVSEAEELERVEMEVEERRMKEEGERKEALEVERRIMLLKEKELIPPSDVVEKKSTSTDAITAVDEEKKEKKDGNEAKQEEVKKKEAILA